MRATIRDAYGALTPRNIALIIALVLLSVVMLNTVGYLIFRRFPIPTLIIYVAVLGWRIGRLIGHVGLSKLLNAASVGLGLFGIIHWFAAVIDGTYWPVYGYASWCVHSIMWGWIAFHLWRAYKVLKEMPPDHRMHVTEGTETIYAQMTYRQARIQKALESYEEAKFKFAVA